VCRQPPLACLRLGAFADFSFGVARLRLQRSSICSWSTLFPACTASKDRQRLHFYRNPITNPKMSGLLHFCVSDWHSVCELMFVVFCPCIKGDSSLSQLHLVGELCCRILWPEPDQRSWDLLHPRSPRKHSSGIMLAPFAGEASKHANALLALYHCLYATALHPAMGASSFMYIPVNCCLWPGELQLEVNCAIWNVSGLVFISISHEVLNRQCIEVPIHC